MLPKKTTSVTFGNVWGTIFNRVWAALWMSKRFCSDFLIGHYSEKDDIPFPKGLNPSDSLRFGSFKMSNAQAREHFSSLQLLTRGSDSSCDYQKHQIEDEAKVRLDSLPYYFLDNGELHGIPTLRRSAGC